MADPARAPTGRAPVYTILLLALLTLSWGCVVRATAPDRVLMVHPDHGRTMAPVTAPDTSRRDTLRVLAWNIAHGRGDLMQGNLQNFRGGGPETRSGRLAAIAETILAADADVVVLNEVDFDAAWSRGLNQAEMLAWATGYPTRVEQRNFDYSILFADFAFGNAVLTRRPVLSVRHVPIPPYSALEQAVLGAKTASVIEIDTRAGPVGVVPVHLEFRSEATRRAAVPALTALRYDAPPLILAGDFNTAPPDFPRTADTTALGALVQAGFTSPRTAMHPDSARLTFPAPDPSRAIDWILAEGPRLRVLEARVIDAVPGVPNVAALSDHLPVLSVVEVRGGE